MIVQGDDKAPDRADPHGVAGGRVRIALLLGLLFASTVINYTDRQSLSILARTIQDALHLTDLDYANVIEWFLLPYTIAFLFAGRLTDRWGARKAMVVFIAVWSFGNLCTGFVRTGVQLAFARFILGVGEPGNWVAAPKAIAETFGTRTRPIALSLITAGATVGAAVAPPLVSVLALRYGWRSAFVVTGVAGFIWIIPWLATYPKNTQGSLPEIQVRAGGWRTEAARWLSVLSLREMWLLALLRMITDPVWFFYLFWFPKYLTDAHHLSLGDLGNKAWVIYLAADVGGILAGLAANRLMKRGRSPLRAEQLVMTVVALLAPMGALIPLAGQLNVVLLLAGVVTFAHMGWQMLAMAIAFHHFPKKLVGTAWGVACAASGLGALASTSIVGHVVTSFSYTPVFVGLACLHPLALFLLWSIRPHNARPVIVGAGHQQS